MARKAVAKRITRRQALSYERTAPNPLGVTTIAAVNGRGAYARRYDATLRLLGSVPKRPRRAPKAKGTTMRRRRGYGRNYEKIGYAKFIAKQKARGRSPKQARSDWAARQRIITYKASTPVAAAPRRAKKARRTRRAVARPAAARGGKRTYGRGKFKALRSRAGAHTRWTYMYRTPKGGARHIPLWAELGYSSAKRAKAAKGAGGKRAEVYERKASSIAERRRKAVDRVTRQIQAGRYPYAPNAAMTYEEWKENMKPNRRRRKTRRTRARYEDNRRRRRTRRKSSVRRRLRPASRLRLSRYQDNRRRRIRRRRLGFRAFRRNAGTFFKDFLDILKIGGIVVVGFVGQKALTKLVAEKLLAGKLPVSLQPYTNSVAGLLVAAVGTALAAKVLPGDAKKVGAGMAAGLVHTIAKDALASKPEYLSYLGDYTEARGNPQYSGMGSYYTFQPHQVYNGYGEYYVPQATSGFGLAQEAAGFGVETSQLRQAAAGMGGAQLTQAAAGMGEYLLMNGKAIGEYEQVTPEFAQPTTIDEGISPDLDSAERALTVAEAAAGVGVYGGQQPTVPLQSMVNPYGYPEQIPDLPGGSRSGSFTGQNGIFG